MNNKINPIIWKLLWPIRAYIRYSPLPRGKSFLARHLIFPILPSKGSFTTDLGHNLEIKLRYNETLGCSILLYGGFETAELDFLSKKISTGDTVLDVGANIGIFSLVFANAVGVLGKVLALEPHPHNIERLRNNIELMVLKMLKSFQLQQDN
ncbi:MAG: FkbM family methyltransferase [Thioploca sp.]|nr:FkbM family methyltransferase [Thioploca sp.]